MKKRLRFYVLQVVIVPVGMKKDADPSVMAAVRELESTLKAAGLRVLLDADLQKTPGWKFNYHEMRGVPLRIEVR